MSYTFKIRFNLVLLHLNVDSSVKDYNALAMDTTVLHKTIGVIVANYH